MMLAGRFPFEKSGEISVKSIIRPIFEGYYGIEAQGLRSFSPGQRNPIHRTILLPELQKEFNNGGSLWRIELKNQENTSNARKGTARGFKMNKNPNPIGAQMIERQWIVKEKMERMLRKGSEAEFASSRGWHFIAELEYYARYEPHTAKAISAYLNHRLYRAGTPMPSWVFKVLSGGSEPETIRRRVQEIQSPERKAVDEGRLEIENAIYLPTERVLNKRSRLEFAMRNEFGKGQYTVSDFIG